MDGRALRPRWPLHQSARGTPRLCPCVLLLRHALNAPADTKYMSVRVPQVHLADIPRHVGRWESHIEAGGHALFVNLINVIHPHGHPSTFVSRLVSVRSKCGGVRSPASAALPSLAKKNLAFA